jgi:hypothetical protein
MVVGCRRISIASRSGRNVRPSDARRSCSRVSKVPVIRPVFSTTSRIRMNCPCGGTSAWLPATVSMRSRRPITVNAISPLRAVG